MGLNSVFLLRAFENIFSAHTTDMPEESFFFKSIKRVFAFVLSFSAGLLNGWFGAGGGMLVVPALTSFCGVDRRSAHATAIAVVLPLSILSAVLYTIGGTYSFGSASFVGIGVLLGGVIGATLLKRIPTEVLTVVFYGIMIYAGVRTVLR